METLETTETPSHFHFRGLFLSSLGIIHLIAFWSYYEQFPGLLSSSGIEPVQRSFHYVAPTLHNLNLTDEDSLCELMAIIGMLLGLLAASGMCQHGILFGCQTFLYNILVRSGGPFYSFQWDTLLLETTAITTLTYAPWLCIRSSGKSGYYIASWPLRFLLFKLMFQSGVVKLQAMCPTWWNLTALEFHFSTQCLPGPMAWHAHQSHPFLLRLGVACTLWLEIPATVFILSPFRTIRKVGAISQILLQVLIILTGNYNFFNLLTMALCLPLLDDDVFPVRKPSRMLQHLCLMFCGLYSIITWMYMFSFSTVNNALSIKLIITPNDVDRFTSTLVPIALLCVFSFITFQTLHHHPTPSRVLHGLVCLIFLSIISLPMYDLTPTLKLHKSAGSQWNGVKQVIIPLYQNVARPYLLANGYGLFRRMTGVGLSSEGAGWAGQLPSVVERPEVIIEVETEEGKWHEVQFRWKPGNVTVLSKQVAPHAPRLDWQLWFAALGRFNHNPWFLNLIQKMLDGCEPVLELIGDPTLKSQKIRRIKSKLYHYDFTRVEADWSKSIPGVKILPGTFWSRIMTMRPKAVWNRKLAREYMGTIDAGNLELSQYLRSQGYGRHCEKSGNRCDGRGRLSCSIMKFIRINRVNTFIPVILVILFLSKIIRYKRKDIAKSTTYVQKDKKQ